MNGQLARITKEAEEKYPLPDKSENLTESEERAYLILKAIALFQRAAHIEVATPYAERSEKLRDALEEADTVLASMEDYLHGDDGNKVSAIRNKINSALNQSK